MDYERISNDQFEEIMDGLFNLPVWLKIQTASVTADILYENFEFLSFQNGKWQFGRDDSETYEYDNLIISKDFVSSIHRNTFAPGLGAEQICLSMCCGTTKLYVEYNYQECD